MKNMSAADDNEVGVCLTYASIVCLHEFDKSFNELSQHIIILSPSVN